ncbi:MAG: acyl-CoA-binding protein [Acidimicrobiia bacterium]|jgi:acyl-CoA-binding protein
MSDIESAFTTAVAQVKQLRERPGNDDLLRLYALYKQATSGDVSGDRPGMIDFVNRAKYDAWAALRGTPRDDAIRSYIDVVDGLKATQAD